MTTLAPRQRQVAELDSEGIEEREYRARPNRPAHIVRTEPRDDQPWSSINGILMRGGQPSYCGIDVTDFDEVAPWPDRVCRVCDMAYFAEGD